MSAPRPYPQLAAFSRLWRKHDLYWIAYDPDGPTIAGVFFETDGVPSRLR